ncbi:HlyD family efflux transporter periplasmic adaptor subunit [Cellulomonas sp. H30R-01]|uniref:efflux RND transporter periplasmic adaptor subunit n=1 Tax=Cellulomonas sp. H30R-01 TaxID=2704467 RepID=UPI00138C1995|nr:HlyD family efflux transporter periplasmic adaptor subunit [Cellulomonas sp. H30R-01]QHT56740.1 HlyD family efflux transporter periplasmic adaptor subunit [Cellulomonas sp. H30R-01]
MRDATRPAGDATVPGADAVPRADAAPHPSTARSARRRARRRTVALATAGAVVLCGVGGGVALALGGDGSGRYRTATAGTASVEQSVDAVGSVASATRRDASFSVAGTVATVDVAVGEQVTAGETLATLDAASLQDAVDDAEAALADAQDQLDTDLASQTSSASTDEPDAADTPSGSTGPTATTTPSPSEDPADDSPATGPGGSDGSADAAVQAAVAAVRAAQEDLLAQAAAAHDALAASSGSVEAARTACAAFLELVADDGEPQPTPSTPSGPSTDPTGDATGEQVAPGSTTDVTADDEDGADGADGADPAVADALADCEDAISGTLDAQEATDAAQQALTALATTLDEAVGRLREAVTQALAAEGATGEPTGAGPTTGGPVDGTTGTTGTTATTGATGTTGTTGATGATGTAPSATSDTRPDGSDTTGGGVASAATILADQAAVAAAEAEVALARAALPFGTLTSPIAGTVAAVSLAPGDPVGASSSTAVVTVLGGDGHTVTTTVGLADVDLVAVGQAATVTTPSTDVSLPGTVSSIGVLDVSSTSEPSYTVEIALDATQERLFDGASAQVVVQVAGVDDVLTVPTSAVRTADGATTVQVLDGDSPSTVDVVVGAVGAERTEIVSGLSEGDEVVLADLDQPVEGASGSTSTGLSGLGDDQRGPVVIQGGPPVDLEGGPPSTRTAG